ncbi:TolC family protein, partial [Myxococcota bacterium]|nr:TolC family protein [Myxococcota bacterium]
MSFVWVLAALAAPPLGAHATITSSQALTFEEVLAAAARAPVIEASSRAIEARAALDTALGALPGNPELKLSPGLRVYGDRAADFEPAISLLQPVDLSGALRARDAAAARETSSLRAELRATRLGAALDAARAWIALWATER